MSLSEHEVHWRSFLESLKQRRLGGVQLVTSDDHAGLRAARLAVFGGLPWQRCQFHLQQNAQAYVPRKDMLSEVAADIRTIFDAPDRTTNDVERLHREVRRRARVVSIFPNPASCLRLVSAVLAEIREEWLTGRTYQLRGVF